MEASLGPVAFSRMLDERFGLKMSSQAIGKAPFLPRDKAGKIVVQDALIVLAERGRITIDGIAEKPIPGELPLSDDPIANGRPRAKGSALYDEQAETEKLRRRKLQIEIGVLEGRMAEMQDVTEALVAGARTFGERIKRITLYADELDAAARSGGTNAVREVLVKIARALQEGIAADLRATQSPEDDESDP